MWNGCVVSAGVISSSVALLILLVGGSSSTSGGSECGSFEDITGIIAKDGTSGSASSGTTEGVILLMLGAGNECSCGE